MFSWMRNDALMYREGLKGNQLIKRITNDYCRDQQAKG